MKRKGSLYAIYKNGIHKGNERGHNKIEAIKNYIRASLLTEFIGDTEFIRQYSAIVAINGVHHHFVTPKPPKPSL